jgi:tetratricopeptide (TPR) repeat protein
MGAAGWGFRHPLMQEACYETLLKRERRALHGAIGNALNASEGDSDRAPASVVARHFEYAERWSDAAEAYQRAGVDSERLFVNRGALELFDRARKMLDHLPQKAATAPGLSVRIEASAARVHLRIGGYADALDSVERGQRLATAPEDVAELLRLSALAHIHTGRTDQAEVQLREAAEIASRGSGDRGVLLTALCDLSDLLQQANRLDEASEFLRDCRNQIPTSECPISIRADMLEGKIAHTRGRYEEALTFYERAYATAKRIGSLTELAGAANSMGTAARDRGDYASAESHQSEALELYKRIGDPAGVEFARNNLGTLAMSRGDLEGARLHLEGARAAARELGHVKGEAGAEANLAILANERGDGAGAVASAQAAITLLSGSQHEVLRNQILVVLAEGHLACRDAGAARAILSPLLGDEIEHQPAVVRAGAARGLGRAALLEDNPSEALHHLSHALELYESLTREQEAARTRFHMAEALVRSGNANKARAEIERARTSFVSMDAKRDIARADELLSQIPPDTAR